MTLQVLHHWAIVTSSYPQGTSPCGFVDDLFEYRTAGGQKHIAPLSAEILNLCIPQRKTPNLPFPSTKTSGNSTPLSPTTLLDTKAKALSYFYRTGSRQVSSDQTTELLIILNLCADPHLIQQCKKSQDYAGLRLEATQAVINIASKEQGLEQLCCSLGLRNRNFTLPN